MLPAAMERGLVRAARASFSYAARSAADSVSRWAQQVAQRHRGVAARLAGERGLGADQGAAGRARGGVAGRAVAVVGGSQGALGRGERRTDEGTRATRTAAAREGAE